MNSFRKYSFYISILFLITGIGSCGYGALILKGDGNLTGLTELLFGGFALVIAAIIYAIREKEVITRERGFSEDRIGNLSLEANSFNDWGKPLLLVIASTKLLEVIGLNNWNIHFLFSKLLLIGIALTIYGTLIYFTCNQRSWAKVFLIILLAFQALKSIPVIFTFNFSMLINLFTLAGYSYCMYKVIEYKFEDESYYHND